jgi:hypothetical protein
MKCEMAVSAPKAQHTSDEIECDLLQESQT